MSSEHLAFALCCRAVFLKEALDMTEITLTRLTEDDREQFRYEGEDFDGMFRFEKQMK